MTEALKTISLFEGNIQENPFEVKAHCPILLSSEVTTRYNTKIKMKLPSTVDLKIYNTNNAIALSHYFQDDYLYLVLIANRGGWIKEEDIIVTCEFVNIKKANVRFVKIENGIKTFNIISNDIKNINEKNCENKEQIKNLFSEEINEVKFGEIQSKCFPEYNEAIFEVAKNNRDIFYIVSSESNKECLMNKFANGNYKGKMTFILKDDLEREIRASSEFPQNIVVDCCEESTIDVLNKMFEDFNVKKCNVIKIT